MAAPRKRVKLPRSCWTSPGNMLPTRILATSSRKHWGIAIQVNRRHSSTNWGNRVSFSTWLEHNLAATWPALCFKKAACLHLSHLCTVLNHFQLLNFSDGCPFWILLGNTLSRRGGHRCSYETHPASQLSVGTNDSWSAFSARYWAGTGTTSCGRTVC